MKKCNLFINLTQEIHLSRVWDTIVRPTQQMLERNYRKRLQTLCVSVCFQNSSSKIEQSMIRFGEATKRNVRFENGLNLGENTKSYFFSQYVHIGQQALLLLSPLSLLCHTLTRAYTYYT